MTMRAVGICGNGDCGQMDLLWEDGYCSATCRAEVTGCEVPGCPCTGGCAVLDPASTRDRSP